MFTGSQGNIKTIKLCIFIWVFSAGFVFKPETVAGQYELPTLGIEVKPVIPSDLFASSSGQTQTYKNKEFNIYPKLGFSGGAVIRFNLSRIWNLESGIYYTGRVYGTSMKDSGGVNITDKFRFDNYEVPFLGLIYIKLTKQLYINNAFGLSLDFFPTDVQAPDNGYYVQKVARQYWVLPALMANVGVEYRTAKKGYFYLGGLYHRMLTPMGQAAFYFDDNGFPEHTDPITIQGHYFALDFKYFFSTERTPVINNGF